MSQHGVEIDLIIDRPGQPAILVEIKSTEKISTIDASALIAYAKDFPESPRLLLSRDPQEQSIEGVLCLFWKKGLDLILQL